MIFSIIYPIDLSLQIEIKKILIGLVHKFVAGLIAFFVSGELRWDFRY